MLPSNYMDQFVAVMSTHAFASASQKAFKHSMRKLVQRMDENDLRDVETMRMYRTSLPAGTRNILSTTWRLLRETEVGADLPELPHVPLVVYPHPLVGDITHLGAVLGNELLGELTWGEAKTRWGWDEACVDCAGRVWWYFMPPDSVPTSDSPLVIKDDKARPIQLWMTEYIINSPDYVLKHKKTMKEARMVKFAFHAFMVASRLRVEADYLKHIRDRVRMVGDKFTQLDMPVMIAELDRILATKNYARLSLIIDSLPIGKDRREPEQKEPVDPIYAAMGLKGPPRGHTPSL